MYPVNICSTTNRWIYPLSPAKIQILFRRYSHLLFIFVLHTLLFICLTFHTSATGKVHEHVWTTRYWCVSRCYSHLHGFHHLSLVVYIVVLYVCVCVVASYWKALSDFTSQFQINFCEFSHRKMEKNDKFNSERSAAGYVTPKASKLRCCEWSTDSRNI